ncbi:MAG: Lipid A core--O-antigen ligase-like protein [bacterium F082]|nr:MAG: Lipid A core--O-antigen ligase-like protein [bacterium F082]KWW30683.1 MAG: Lipid A core--O-antigen ligase-like protein [bacterium P201]
MAVGLFLVVKKNTYLFFALPVVLGVLLLYIFSLDKVLLLTAFTVPLSINLKALEAGLAISLPAEPLLIGIMVLFFAKMLYDGKYDKRISHHPIAIVIYCMFAWMLVTTITSEMPVVSLKFILSRLWFVIPAFFLCAILFKKPKNIHWFIWLYIAALCIVCVYTIIHHAQFGFDGDSAHWVMTPFYNDHTAYGAALAIYLILALTYVFLPGIKTSRRLIIIGVVALLSVALVFSNCRAAWLSVIAALAVLICVLLKIKFRWIATVVVVLVGLFLAFQNQIIDTLEKNNQDASGDLVENIQSITNISTDASNLERINRWQSAFRLFNERPVFGWGPGTYQFVYAPYQMSKEKTIISTNAGDGGNAHSEYFGPLAEQGIVGSILVLILVIVTVYHGMKTYKRCKNRQAKTLVLGATLAFISYFVHGLLNNFMDTDKLAVPVWSLAALIAAIDVYYADKETFDEVKE